MFGIPLALTVPQILAVDLGTDMVPALALGAEKPDAGIMSVPPRPRTERLMNLPLLLRAYVFLGLIEAGIAMGSFFLLLLTEGWTWNTPLDWSDPLYKQATAATFAAIVVAQVANVFACRSDRVSLSRLGLFSNPLLLWGIATELVVLAFIIYTPWGNEFFGTGPLPLWIFGPLALGALGLLFAEECRKIIMNRFTNSRAGGVTRRVDTA
jgi:sodium/potassium-transporting ATPase subunit alpha